MKESLVMTLIGPDRPGLVEELSAVIEDHGGNWEESRMVELAGEFAGILHVHVPPEKSAALEEALGRLDGVSVTVARAPEAASADGGRAFEMEIVGQDHPGIVHSLSRAVASYGVNIEVLETEVFSAPMSGESMFKAAIQLRASADADLEALKADLEKLAADLMVDLELDEY